MAFPVTLFDELNRPYTDDNPLIVVFGSADPGSGGAPPNTATPTSVADTDVSVTLLAANDDRDGASFTNTSSSVLLLLLGTGTASATNYTLKIVTGQCYFLDVMKGGVYTGIIKGIWVTDPNDGACLMLEFT